MSAIPMSSILPMDPPELLGVEAARRLGRYSRNNAEASEVRVRAIGAGVGRV